MRWLVAITALATSFALMPMAFATAGVADHLTLTTSAAGAAASGEVFTTQPIIAIRDTDSNTVTSDTSTVTVTLTGGAGTFIGGADTATATASSGVATFSGLGITGGTAGETYTLTFTDGSLTQTSQTIVLFGTATKLGLTTSAAGAASGAAFTTQPVVTIQDTNTVTVTSDTSTVTVTLTGGAGHLLDGTDTATATASAGVASFSGLGIRGTAGTYTLTFTDGSLTLVSQSIVLGAGAAAKLDLTAPAVGAASGAPFGTQPTITIQDAESNTVTSDTSTVTVTVSGGDGLATLVGSDTATASAGIATFSGLGINGTAGQTYTLTYHVSGLTDATQTITPTVGAANKLAITSAPSGAVNGVALTGQPAVRVVDSGGNTITTDTTTVVTAAILSGSGTLSGTVTATAASGIAYFTNLAITGTAGNYTLRFTAPTLTAINSASFSLTAGAATKLAITSEPSGAVNAIAFTGQPIVTIQDSESNTVTTDETTTVTAAIASGSGTLSGTTTVTAIHGVATFTDLAITGAAGGYTLIFTSNPSLTSATSASFTLSIAAPMITSFTPTAGLVGDSVTISGGHLLSALSVSFGSTTAAITSNTDTSIVVVVPTGVATGPITVTTAGGTTTTASNFTFGVGRLTALSLSAGGAAVALTTTFAPSTLSYQAYVTGANDSVALELTTGTSETVTVTAPNGVGVITPVSGVYTIPGLIVGGNTITIHVGAAADVYAVTVIRLPDATNGAEYPALDPSQLPFSIDQVIGFVGTTPVTATITIPAGAFTESTVFKVKVPSSATDIGAGFSAVGVTAYRGGVLVTGTVFATAISIAIPAAAIGSIPSLSTDGGVTWQSVRELSSVSDSLVSGFTDGYIRSGSTVTFYTTHLTDFGLKTSQDTLAVTSSTTAYAANSTFSLTVSGGSGGGALTYASSDTAICTVSAGTVTTVSLGTCTITVTKAANGRYLAATATRSVTVVLGAGSTTPYTAPPTASVGNPVTQVAKFTEESKVSASIEVAGGPNLTVSVTVPAGASSQNLTVSITPTVTSAEAGTGVVSIKVTITDASGALVTHFDRPLTLSLGKVATDTTAAYSQDGLLWTVIVKLDGHTLPAGVHEGYYLADDGSLIILTDHLTYFGAKRIQTPLVLNANATRIPLGSFASIYTTGGSGSGATAYLTSTPEICSVNDHGLVTALKAGACTVSATKAADGIYLNTSTAPLVLTFVDLTPPQAPLGAVVKSVAVSGRGLLKLIQVNLGASNGGKKVTIQIRKARSTVYKTLCVVTLNKAGMVRTTRQVPLGSTIRVLVGGRSQAATVVA